MKRLPAPTNDLEPKTIKTISVYRSIGTGWMGTLTPDGTVLITTESDHTASSGTAYSGNNDAYCRVYAVGPDGNSMYSVAQFQRKDYLNPAGTPVLISSFFTAFGAVFGWDTQQNLFDGDPIGTFDNKPKLYITDSSVYTLPATVTPPIDLMEGGRFKQPAIDISYWKLNNLNHFTNGTSILDSAEGGTNSVQVDAPVGGGVGTATYTFQQETVYGLQGKWLTFRARVLNPVANGNTQAPYIKWLLGNGDFKLIPIPTSDSWQTIIGSIWVPANEATVALQIISDLTNTLTGKIYLSSISVSEGANFPTGNLIPRDRIIHTTVLAQTGLQQVAVSTVDITLTQLNTNAAIIELTGSPAAGHIINFPVSSGTGGTLKGMRYLINNLTGQTMTIKVTGQTGFALTAGSTCTCYMNGTDMVKI